MMLKTRKFSIEHIDNFLPKDDFYNLKRDLTESSENKNVDMITMFDSYDDVVCIMGVNHLRLGVAEAWLVPGVLVDEYKYSFFRAAHNIIYKYLFPIMGLHRIQIAIEKDWKKGNKWAKTLGFSFEGVMKAYDVHKVDHNLYAKVV